jgi:AcrR family transcriptional regulator
MQPKASDGNDGGAAKSGRPDAQPQIREAMLQVAGEVGYGAVSVQKVLDHQGGSRAQFYRHFDSAAACYAEAYAIEVERLRDALLEAGRGSEDWRDGLEAALGVLQEFATERPIVARGVLIEVHRAGEPSLRVRREVFERLSRAIDSARRETGSRHSPPPLTAMFIIHLIDAALVDSLKRDAMDRFEAAEIAELVAVYYGLASLRDRSPSE